MVVVVGSVPRLVVAICKCDYIYLYSVLFMDDRRGKETIDSFLYAQIRTEAV